MNPTNSDAHAGLSRGFAALSHKQSQGKTSDSEALSKESLLLSISFGQKALKLNRNNLEVCVGIVHSLKILGKADAAKQALDDCIARGKGIIDRQNKDDSLATKLVNNAYRLCARMLMMAGREQEAGRFGLQFNTGDQNNDVNEEFWQRAKSFTLAQERLTVVSHEDL
jgi:hypothetical protein